MSDWLWQRRLRPKPSRCLGEQKAQRAMRIDPAEFYQQDFRAHTFLADAPLHDVWEFSLAGGGDARTIRDIAALFHNGAIEQANPVVRGLFTLRGALGRVLGWDDAQHAIPEASYVNRLTEADRTRSLDEPGSQQGAFRVIYTFPQETLGEIQNATVHAFSLMAMTPTPEGYRVFWAIYVKRISWLTPWYMACIDPFRRFLVYPTVIKRLQQDWTTTYSA